MDTLIAWCGFLGGWLLVAGPVYQASVELSEYRDIGDEVQTVMSAVPAPPAISRWWWLLPPVAYLKQRARTRAHRAAMMERLENEQGEVLLGFINKAAGWSLVAAGASFLALKETWELTRHHYDWPATVFWVLAPLAALLAFGYTAIRMGQTRRAMLNE